MTTAPDILTTARDAIAERAQLRDQPGGERTVPRVVAAFAALTGITLTDEQGWLFLALVKLARATAGRDHPDDYVDGAAYLALMGEAAADAAKRRDMTRRVRDLMAVTERAVRPGDFVVCHGCGMPPGKGASFVVDGSGHVTCRECAA